MENAKISGIQLFILMFIFEMGTSVVVAYGIEAKKDSWMATLFALAAGLILFFTYYALFRYYPSLPLTAYARKIFGNYVGWVIGLLYTLFFLYVSARNVRDFGELLITSAMPETPLVMITILFILTICYVLYLGIEVLARTGEILGVILILIGIIANLLIFSSGLVDLNNLKPVLEHGWKPILETSIYPPRLVFLPFGELVAFAMLFPYLNRSDLVKKIGASSVIVSGLILSYTAALNIAVLGVKAVERSPFPLLSTIGKVNFLDFIQRLDALVVIILLITVFFKAGIFLYSASIAMVDLFQLKNHQQILLPAGVIVTFFSLIMSADFAEHIEEGSETARIYLFTPFTIVLPLIMLIIAFIRHRFHK